MRPDCLYIAPSNGGQCRIYFVPEHERDPRHQSWEDQRAWKEVGLMSFRGQLVCLDRDFQHVITRDDEPLMAGTVFLIPTHLGEP